LSAIVETAPESDTLRQILEAYKNDATARCFHHTVTPDAVNLAYRAKTGLLFLIHGAALPTLCPRALVTTRLRVILLFRCSALIFMMLPIVRIGICSWFGMYISLTRASARVTRDIGCFTFVAMVWGLRRSDALS
jgi:hypothetical protein